MSTASSAAFKPIVDEDEDTVDRNLLAVCGQRGVALALQLHLDEATAEQGSEGKNPQPQWPPPTISATCLTAPSNRSATALQRPREPPAVRSFGSQHAVAQVRGVEALDDAHQLELDRLG
jgi:hypothetical protein